MTDTYVNVPAPLGATEPGAPVALASSTEPIIHGLVGAYYGDWEVDVGKSVRWLEFYTDDIFVTDINTGEQRYWIVNWAESFPYSEHIVTGRNFFLDNVEWRKEQFLAADAAFGYQDADWCLFIDGTEAISFDNRSLPTDYNTAPFMSWIYREISRAASLGQDQVVLPFFAYLKNSDLQNITYGTQANQDNQVLGIPDVQQAVSVPWYLPNKGLPRLFKVSKLRQPWFDWASLDTFVDWQVAPGTGLTVPPYLNSAVGTVTTPNPGALPNDFTIVITANGPVVGEAVSQDVCGQWDADPQRSWKLSWKTDGSLVLTTSSTGNVANAITRTIGTLNPGSASLSRTVALSVTKASGGRCYLGLWEKPSGSAWGMWNSIDAGTAITLFNATSVLRVGNTFVNKLFSVEIRSGLDPTAGTVLWKFDASERTGTGTTYVDPRSRTWTLTNTGAVLPAQVVPAAPAAKAQVVSYAYAHWQPLDVPPGQMTVPPLDANNDLGYKMRNLMSLLRPLPGVPYGSTWNDPTTDPTTLPGPWCIDTVISTDPTIVGTVEEDGHTPPNALTAGVTTPLYDTVIRLNLRDGLWYQQGSSGNIPLAWDDVTQTWVPRYNPDEWEQSGVGSSPEAPPDPSPMSVRLDGASGTYIRTADANYFDFQSALTLLTVMRFDDWTPTERKVIVSKWGAAGQRSWYWGIEPSGKLVFVISRNGTDPIEFVQALPFGFVDGHSVAMGVSFVTHETDLTNPEVPAYYDRVRFWLYDNGIWVQVGAVVQQANPDDLKIFNSNTQVQIGAYLGTTGNAPSLYRQLSLRQGVADVPTEVGGEEVGLMRGDLSNNPTYDRYGNLWTNMGGWTYMEMDDFDEIAHP